MINAIFRSMRPKQWTKNGVVLAGLIFSRNLMDAHMATRAIAATGLFCLLSGAVYLINDIRDIEKDRAHPVKKDRPLPSGALAVGPAWMAAGALAVGSLGLSFAMDPKFGQVALAYFVLICAYSFGLKSIVLIDVFTIASGFVLRAVAGVVAIASMVPAREVAPSPWLLVCTFLLATFLALAKRRNELSMMDGVEAGSTRSVLSEYSLPLVDQLTAIVSASTVVAYALYTFDDRTVGVFGTHGLALTIPFVMYGIFRYLYLVHRRGAGGSPEIIFLTDRGILVCVLLWLSTAAAIIYGPPLVG